MSSLLGRRRVVAKILISVKGSNITRRNLRSGAPVGTESSVTYTTDMARRSSASSEAITWFAPSGRVRGWVAGLVLFALCGFLLQPGCDAWWVRGERNHAARAGGVQSHRAVRADAYRHSGPDECCIIEAAADHVSPLPSAAIWHDQSNDSSLVPSGLARGKISFAAGVSYGVAYRPPDRGKPYHARSARLLL
jgi:hypothetical protein